MTNLTYLLIEGFVEGSVMEKPTPEDSREELLECGRTSTFTHCNLGKRAYSRMFQSTLQSEAGKNDVTII